MTDEINTDPIADDPPETPIRSNYQGNTHKSRDKKNPISETKNLDKVITGKVVERKPSVLKNFKKAFGGDNMRNVGTFVLYEVLVPSLKAMISDVVSKGSERALWGDSRRGSTQSGHVGYNRMFAKPEPRRDISYRARASHDFNEIILETRGEAEDVLDRLNDLINEFQMASVNDLYDLVGITGAFTDDKWGWTHLRGARVERIREGYLLNLPQTTPLT